MALDQAFLLEHQRQGAHRVDLHVRDPARITGEL
jgi:hypothetical protein